MIGWKHTAQRSTEDELMDTEPVSFAEFQDCLQDLETINRFTFAYPPTVQWLRKAVRCIPKSQPVISIFDIGSGGGDMLRLIRRSVKTSGQALQLTGIDLNPWSKATADAATDPALTIQYETADIFTLDPAQRADFIISSLFTHHLRDADLIRFIRWMEAHATAGWLINDLHRHPVPYYFIKDVVRLFRLNRLVISDAPISVARAFRRRDWQRLLQEAGLSGQATIQWRFPFRYIVTRQK